jgi:uncharacterized protein
VRKRIRMDIDQLLDGDKTIRMELPPTPEFSIEGAAELDVTLSRRGENVYVEGKVTFVQRLECSRCSERISRRRTEPVEAIYTPYAPSETELDLAEADVDVLYYQGNTIDLEQPVRDAIVLSVPMRFLCSPECKGLCPVCGANLNRGKCACSQRPTDPRWKDLERLLF